MELYNDDCFNVFHKISDKSINLFILDLPYANKKFGNCTSCKWDTPIDLKKMWVEIKRIMKKNAVIVFFCNTKFGYCLIHSNPKWFSYQLIWEKNKKVGFLSANRKPLVNIENIYVFKKEQGTYNAQKTPREKDYNHSGKRTSEEHYGDVIECKKLYKKEDGKHPTTILKFNNPSKPLHRTQKPVDLLEWLIKSYSNEKDLIMDFTMGSGSTGIACLNTNRRFIGIEKDEEIFKIAKKRLNTKKL
tara:strand:- start:2038 stop:2772 length:735 start_codon:yes stop_codon:yes gene_type:complete